MKNPNPQSSIATKASERASATRSPPSSMWRRSSSGEIVMSFEMLGSRYLNPYFGSSIYTWAALISTVLAALTAGYFLGELHRQPHGIGGGAGGDYHTCVAVPSGAAEFRRQSPQVRFRQRRQRPARRPLFGAGDHVRASDASRRLFAFCHTACAPHRAEFRHGFGRRLWCFHRGLDCRHPRHDIFFDPTHRNARYHVTAGAAGIFCGACLMALEHLYARRKVETLAIAILWALAAGCGSARSEGLFDEGVRAKMLQTRGWLSRPRRNRIQQRLHQQERAAAGDDHHGGQALAV